LAYPAGIPTAARFFWWWRIGSQHDSKVDLVGNNWVVSTVGGVAFNPGSANGTK